MSIFPPVDSFHAVHNSVRQLVSTNLGPHGRLMSKQLLKHLFAPLNEQKCCSELHPQKQQALSALLVQFPSYRSVRI